MVNCVVPVLADNPLVHNLVLVSLYTSLARARERCVAGVLQSVLQCVLLFALQRVCCSACGVAVRFLFLRLFCRVQCVQCVVGKERVERERHE